MFEDPERFEQIDRVVQGPHIGVGKCKIDRKTSLAELVDIEVSRVSAMLGFIKRILS
jgi:hypothetical protein